MVAPSAVLAFSRPPRHSGARMKEVEEILGNGFFRCHRGYLVNFAAVKSFEVGTILLKNGESILMAKQKFNDFASAYETYLNER